MIKLVQVKKEEETILHHLMQFYIYEFSQYIPAIKLDENGAYKPFDLRGYWEFNNKFAYFIKNDEELIGFALIEEGKDSEPNCIKEFFIIKKYNGKGFGAIAATKLFDSHKGQWRITQILNNYPAQAFWRKVINQYTDGTYKEYYDEKRRSVQEFIS